MNHLIPRALFLAILTLLSTGTPAVATPDTLSDAAVWQVTSNIPSVIPKPSVTPAPASPGRMRRSTDSAAVRTAAEEDLKTDCQNRQESRSVHGWARSRFEQCFIGSRTAHLISRQSGIVIATISFEYSLLAFAVDGSRRIDYVFDFDDFDTLGGQPLPVTTLTVNFTGCGGLVECSPSVLPTRSELVPDWKTGNRLYQFSVTSPDDTGDGTFKIARSEVQMNMSIVTLAPDIVPWEERGMAASRARFDSARSALGQGKFHGAIFPDNIPTLQLNRGAGTDHFEEAVHVDDALHNTIRTFPSFFGKWPPGEGDRPLHRMMNGTLINKNHDASVSICEAVWGKSYTTGGKQCDEYPFKTTYEGSATSTGATEANPNGGNPFNWHGSARPIKGTDNGNGGNVLGLFYGQNRVLDENVGTPQQGTPSDPFRVIVLK
jgi:hypothetical protein